MKKFWRYLLIGFSALLMVGVVGFLLWATNPARPEAYALEHLQSSDGVVFEDLNNWLVFSPANTEPAAGLILYPGGRVDYRAYAPHARAIAEEGFTVVVVPMPLNLAFLGINRADAVIAAMPDIDRWAVGGHSLGGAMAAEFAQANPGRIAGLVLWASYPGANNDLSDLDLPVLSVFADRDGVATLADIADSRDRLPLNTIFIDISGGNHAGFGWYGDQNGDGEATLSKNDQQAQIVTATAAFLGTLGE